MLNPSFKTLIEYARRIMTCAMLMFCVMPIASEAEAATHTLGQEMWANTGFCLVNASSSPAHIDQAGMTPDARAYKLSIELQALQEMLRAQQGEAEEIASSLDAPCEEVDEHLEGPALCPQPEAEKVAEPEIRSPRFVAATLIEDIVPLERPEAPSHSCSTSSSGPDRCESYPAHPQRLHLDVTFSSAVLGHALSTPVRQDTKSRTLPLVRALPRDLLEAASGHSRDDERPPEA